MGQGRISITNQENKICTLYALIMILYYDTLQYCTYKMLEEQCLPVKSWVVTEARIYQKTSRLTSLVLLLCYNIIDFIGSCCRFDYVLLSHNRYKTFPRNSRNWITGNLCCVKL